MTIIVDCETTGVEVIPTNGIISIGAVDFANPTRERFYGEGRVRPGVMFSRGAMEINGMSPEMVAAFPQSIGEVLVDFCTWILASPSYDGTKVRLAGQNPRFDLDFIQMEMTLNQIWNKPGEIPKFSYRTIDIQTACTTDHVLRYGKEPERELGGDLIAEYLSLPAEPKPHNALNGACWEAEFLGRLWYGKNMMPEFSDYPVVGDVAKPSIT